MDICVCITDSLCCTAETNNIVNHYTSIKINKKNQLYLFWGAGTDLPAPVKPADIAAPVDILAVTAGEMGQNHPDS